MHSIGQILNYDERREFQNGGTEHIYSPIHIVDALGLDEDDERKDDEVVFFIDKYISCLILNEKAYPNSVLR